MLVNYTKMSPLAGFLQNCKIKKGEQYTHTRIGDKNSEIYGGAYFIPISKKSLDISPTEICQNK